MHKLTPLRRTVCAYSVLCNTYSIAVGASFKYIFSKLSAKPNYVTNKYVNKKHNLNCSVNEMKNNEKRRAADRENN